MLGEPRVIARDEILKQSVFLGLQSLFRAKRGISYDYLRAFMFVVIASVVAILSGQIGRPRRLSSAQKSLKLWERWQQE